MQFLLLLIILIPALEIGVFVWAGGIIGPWWVIAFIFITGALGVFLARLEGIDIWHRAQQSIEEGLAPTEQIIDGLCVLVGAILLFTPGFVTDLLGLFLIVPFTRYPFKKLMMKWIQQKIKEGKIIYRR